jgi:hypothetical protein
MNSTLKILVPLGVLLAVIFAITFFSQNVPTDEPETKAKAEAGGEPPLRFFTSTRKWDPWDPFEETVDPDRPRPDIQNRNFPGYFEPSDTLHPAAFWFENTNDRPVKMRLVEVGCASCTEGRLAPIPPDATRALLQMTAVSLLPQGPVTALPLGLAGPAANLVPALPWTGHSFQDITRAVFDVPAAANKDGWSPQWGILELRFKATGKVPVTAKFATQVEGTDQAGENKFEIYYAAANPFEVNTTSLEVGELTSASAVQELEFIIGSTTRTWDQLADLSIRVDTPGGFHDTTGFVTVGKPTPLQGADLKRAVDQLQRQAGHPLRLQSVIRVPVTVRPRVGEARLDIGKLEREIWVSIPNAPPKQVSLKGTVRGPVYLTDGKEIDLGIFEDRSGATVKRELTTERAGMELAVVPDECLPKTMKVNLEKLPDRNGRGYYQITVTMPPNEQYGEITGGVVTLEVKGPGPQKVRIPVRGRGKRT